jgi:hypothetical protein
VNTKIAATRLPETGSQRLRTLMERRGPGGPAAPRVRSLRSRGETSEMLKPL